MDLSYDLIPTLRGNFGNIDEHTNSINKITIII